MRKLYLITEFAPNTFNSPCIVFNSPAGLISYLNNSHKIIKTIDLNNYRINNNVIKVYSQDSSLFNSVTYAIDYDETGYFRAYHVNEVLFQSDMTILSCSVDYWSSYMNRFIRQDIIVNKTNRNIGVGIYDDIEATIGDKEITRLNTDFVGGFISNENVGIVIQVEFNASQSQNEHISMTQLFALDISSLKASFSGINDNAILVARDFVGGIYAVTSGVLGFSKNDAKVIKAWLVDYRQIDVGASGARTQIEFISKCRYSVGNDKKIKFYYCLPSIKTAEVRIPSNVYDINKSFLIGTYNDGIKLTRFTTEELFAYYTYIVDDSVKVIVSQGENAKDISSSFELELTTNSLVETSLRKVAKALTKTASTTKSILKGFEEGDITGLGLTGASTLASLVGGFSVSGSVGGGNGLTTFFTKEVSQFSTNVSYSPYVLTAFNSINDEEERLELNGANYNKLIVNGLDNLYEFPMLKGSTETYIQGKFKETLKLPTEAVTAIQSLLQNGTFIEYLF